MYVLKWGAFIGIVLSTDVHENLNQTDTLCVYGTVMPTDENEQFNQT